MSEPESLEVKTAFGSAKATGGQLIFVLLAVLLAVLLGYQAWIHDAAGKDRSGVIIQHVDSLKGSVEALTEAVRVQTYVSTLDAKGKADLDLDKPDSLVRRRR